ncbi:hypothetical protein BDQ17DRAFT_1218042, partial [Cyathus striatus]
HRHISRELKEVVVCLDNKSVSHYNIWQFTGVARSTQKQILTLYQSTGDVCCIPVECNRKHCLTSLDIVFLESCIEWQPDIMLSELQAALETTCTVSVSLTTISHMLKRCRFTQKQV